MCGAYYLRQSQSLRDFFGIESERDVDDFMQSKPAKDPRLLFDSEGDGDAKVFRPTDEVPFIAESKDGALTARRARWWLLMQQEQGRWVPNQAYASFNSMIDKVVGPGRSAHSMRPKSFRVLIPAHGFIEWHDRKPYAFTRQDNRPLLLGGMAKAYPIEDGFQFAVSIVTLPGHPKTAHIHQKSIPLMLEDDETGAWLDRNLPHSDFQFYQTPQIRTDLEIQQLESVKSMASVGDAQVVPAD